jgi:hypothetical protein
LLDFFAEGSLGVGLRQEIQVRFARFGFEVEVGIAGGYENYDFRGTLVEVVTQLLAGATRQHHVGHDQGDFLSTVFLLALIVNFQSLRGILGRQNYEAGAFQNAAGGFADKWFVLNQENNSPARSIFGADVRLKSHYYPPLMFCKCDCNRITG